MHIQYNKILISTKTYTLKQITIGNYAIVGITKHNYE